jgi:hypothetical protein
VSRRLFTVSEANESLPRVSRLMMALQDRFRWLKEHQQEVPYLLEERHIVNESPVDQIYFRALLAVRRLVREAETLGVQIKDVSSGLVDFPSRLYGREVLLCWKLGETQVRFWHDQEAGFSGRQPIPEGGDAPGGSGGGGN